MSANPAQPVIRPQRQTAAPRFIRLVNAAGYLGLSRDEFNRTARPALREFPIGQRGIGFDREDLDAWASAYVDRLAIDKPGLHAQQSSGSERPKGETSWREKPLPASRKGKVSGISTRKSTENDFTKALELVTGKKLSAT